MIKSISLFVLLALLSFQGMGQERYGHTFNFGLGVGYFGYLGRPVPVLNFNYEIDVVKNLTLAPFLGFYTHGSDYYYGNGSIGFRNYAYRETVIPVGIRSTYYFDDLMNASDQWDFYAGASVGFSIVSQQWDAGYTGNRNVYAGAQPFFVSAHIGAEYHFTPKLGGFLDLSTNISSVGLAIHK